MTPETEHMLTMLKTAMRVLGFTNRDVERKLGLSSSYLSRLFSGLIELKFQHIVDIARSIGMEPEEMLYFAYPQPKQPPSAAAVRMRALLGGATQAPPAPPASPPPAPSPGVPTQGEIEEMMARTIRRLFGEIARNER
jgi:transcriptional regulator with XRE-family HTH domain